MQQFIIFLILLTTTAFGPLRASESEALVISGRIREAHLPYGTILDPVFAGPQSSDVVGYSRCGDSAIWTGHYLAAEAFRYSVTRSPEALTAVRDALAGVRSLVEVTGTNVLARCLVPADFPYAAGILSEEASHGSFAGTWAGRSYSWVGNTSRDQYSGVFFGLGVAYDLVDAPDVRDGVREVVSRLLDFLLQHNWSVVMPNGAFSTTFVDRPDQQLTLLQIGRRINADRFENSYRWARFWSASSVQAPIAFEVLDDHNSYFKFNLDTINLYHLIRLEDSSYYRWWYTRAYDLLRRTTDDHRNAHFNMIDAALKGSNARRDAETLALLQEWLQRPVRDEWVDWRGTYPSCGAEDRACELLPVARRVRTDFLWQRSPFLLYGGGEGKIESAGIDYILPYWMARYYGLNP